VAPPDRIGPVRPDTARCDRSGIGLLVDLFARNLPVNGPNLPTNRSPGGTLHAPLV